MFAILVTEPSSETPSYVLGTGARTLQSAIALMSSRAEEFISELLEAEADEARDYTIVQSADAIISVTTDCPVGTDDPVLISFEAVAITEVV